MAKSKNIELYKALASVMNPSQTQKILKHLIRYGKITTFQAYEKYGCTRCAARISELRSRGVVIDTQMVYKKTKEGPVHYGVYHLV